VLSFWHMDINVIVEKGFGRQVKADWLAVIAETVLDTENADPNTEADILITGQEQIEDLNRRYLQADHATDVLSFPMLETLPGAPAFVTPPGKTVRIGEVVISYPQAVIQAEEHGHPVKREIAILLIHGILHLLGHDHDITARKKKMRQREAVLLEIIEENYL
jgi:probable rRNA maturation factor